MSAIACKAQFYRLWHAGLLGNRPRTWRTPNALRESGFSGLVTMRAATGSGGGACGYRLTVADALERAKALGAAATFNEACPDDRLLVQGEVARMPGGLELSYSTTPGLAMREAMRGARHAGPTEALTLLRDALSPSSWDDLDALWDLYPDAVIEFSAYDRLVGDQPHRNTLIWEVRNY